MTTLHHLPSEDDLRLRLHFFSLAEAIGIRSSECSLDTYLGELMPIEHSTFCFPGGSVTGSYRQIVAAFEAVKSPAEFVASCRETGILDDRTQ
jgi:hypothetical protein